MTSEKIDPLQFESWEDAFQHPVTTVRRLEQQLRNHAEDNREKLRNLVGFSYRDLLGTAERIINMDAQVQEAEMILGQTGQKSNARAVTRISKTFVALQSERRDKLHERNSLASQMAVLSRCPVMIARILRRQGSLLLAAKLILLSRLIHKALSLQSDVPALAEVLRDRLASLRRKLLQTIDKRFSEPEREDEKLVDDMCAFSLATSSTPSDVLRHFHHIRLEAVRWHLTQNADIKGHAINALHLLLGTLHQSQHIFPKRLSEVLVRLKDQPLIQHFDVQTVSELDFSVHSRWLTEDVQNYTPWPRHDELSKSEAEKMLKHWAKSAQRVFISTLTTAIGHVSDFDGLLGIRKELFEAWPWTDKRLPGLHSADVVDELRDMFNAKLSDIVRAQVSKITLVCQASEAALRHIDERNGQQVQGALLWSSSLTNVEVSSGSESFKDAVIASYSGTSEAISEVVDIYDKSMESIKTLRVSLKQMRETQWDDDFDDDEDNLDSKQALLGEDDPHTLNEKLAKSLEHGAEELLADLSKMVKTVTSVSFQENKSTFALRVLREFIKHTNSQDQFLVSAFLPVVTSPEIISPLHEQIAGAVTMAIEPFWKQQLVKFSSAETVIGRALWEGDRQLPVQPSIMTFRLLKLLVDRMALLGSDLWSGAATRTLKRMVGETLHNHVIKFIASLSIDRNADQVNGNGSHETIENDAKEGNDEGHSLVETNDTEGVDTEEVAAQQANLRAEKLIQLTLDLYYLKAALSSDGSTMTDLISEVEESADLQQSELTRIRKYAVDYWKRTYLLFALLA